MAEAAAEVAASIAGLALSVFKAIVLFDLQSQELEAAWTQSMVDTLRSQHPDKNVMVCHPPHVQVFVNATHVHYELPTLIPAKTLPNHPPGGKPPPGRGPLDAQKPPVQVVGPTIGYEIYVFDSGQFFREGNGGFENWCFSGNFKRGSGRHDSPESNVKFFPITSHPPPRPTPPKVHPPPTTPSASPIRLHSDGVYFVNCRRGNEISSGLAYYRNLNPGGNDGQKPDDYIDVSHGSYTVWEVAGEGTFKTGTRFYWSIFGNAPEMPYSSYSGSADNTYHPFNIYKDNQRVLYEVNGWQCSTIYWCF